MTALRVSVTAEHIAEAEGKHRVDWWQWPMRAALEELTHVDVDIDGGDGDGCVATIGGKEPTTLVVELGPQPSAWLDWRWNIVDRADRSGFGMVPFTFEIELPDWLVALVR